MVSIRTDPVLPIQCQRTWPDKRQIAAFSVNHDDLDFEILSSLRSSLPRARLESDTGPSGPYQRRRESPLERTGSIGPGPPARQRLLEAGGGADRLWADGVVGYCEVQPLQRCYEAQRCAVGCCDAQPVTCAFPCALCRILQPDSTAGFYSRILQPDSSIILPSDSGARL
jgi:hypothetical protein